MKLEITKSEDFYFYLNTAEVQNLKNSKLEGELWEEPFLEPTGKKFGLRVNLDSTLFNFKDDTFDIPKKAMRSLKTAGGFAQDAIL